MAATLRAPARAALASSSSRRARCRSSRRTLAASASASPRGSEVEVITFDLDDTLWPTTPVVMAANQAFVDFCQERIPGFPDCAGVNEYMKAIRKEREERSVKLGERHVPLSFAALRIAGGFRAAIELGVPEPDAIGVVSRGYHIAWIPTRGVAAREHLFDGVVAMLEQLRSTYPNACVGTITNGLGSAAGAGLGDFFDFEISADAMMDEMMVHGDDARKPAAFPFELAGKMAREMRDFSGNPNAWVHVGDDLINDCEAAKTHGPFKTVLVEHPGVVPYQPGGGGTYPGDPAREEETMDRAGLVDARVTSVGEIPGAIADIYAKHR
ncbi:predicted protein [Micromonas commoda]|uniref:Haloacid dehalogenase-like hydrolase n=1 Tax=Micromonas commoda (strain RCC299 / NOUM17 / CCMP2709) TaxID=296587 RepID=C1EFI4_MICCC|nr:predicted protein [Micromonas commoda]ACO66860.1 predicted protein [Micromonas commoda]|eukprot:XP_002505602.1 predicted protein [Micromonas commoda]